VLRTKPRGGLNLFAHAEFNLRGLAMGNIAVDIALMSLAADMFAAAMSGIDLNGGVIVKEMQNGARNQIGSEHH
jgi:hypothetical protein